MKALPTPTKKRLVLLIQILKNCRDKTITSQTISQMTGWSPAVIRKDISYIGYASGASNGYKVLDLLEVLETQLNQHEAQKSCCLVGLGKLGQVYLEKKTLLGSNFEIAAGFDSNVNRTEVLKSDFPLYPTTMLESKIRELGIQLAILSCPGTEAQHLTDKLCAAGIQGIVNCTDQVLTVPKEVPVENISLVHALENLSAGF